MNKLLPWTIASVLTLALVLSWVYFNREWDVARDAQVKASALYADSLASIRLNYASAMESAAAKTDSINSMQRELDSAISVRQPIAIQLHEATRSAFASGLDSMQLLHWTDPKQ